MFTDGCDTGNNTGHLSRRRRHHGCALPAASWLNPKDVLPCHSDGAIGRSEHGDDRLIARMRSTERVAHNRLLLLGLQTSEVEVDSARGTRKPKPFTPALAM